MSFIHFSKNYLNWPKTENSWEKGYILRFILFQRLAIMDETFENIRLFRKLSMTGLNSKRIPLFLCNPIQPPPIHALFCPGGCLSPISLSPSLFYMHLHLTLWCWVTTDTLLLLLSLVCCHCYFRSMATRKTDRPPPPVPHDMAGHWATHPCSHQGQTSTKRAHADEPSVQDVYIFGKDIQNCLPHEAFSPKATEDCCFCLFFGCGLDVALMAWQMLNAYKFFPDSSTLVLLLWALFFMKCYPTEDHACLTVGGIQRAIDPKTLCKHIWPLITGLSD